jgi:hypothetical protein
LLLKWCIVYVLLAILPAIPVIPQPAQSVVINEFLASNGAILTDEDGDYEDWIELYNPTTTRVNLAGYTMTDDQSSSGKWTFPSITIEPKGFLFIWASGKDRRPQMNWNFNRPLIIEFESRGFEDGNSAKILVNRRDKSLNGRGINIVKLDQQGNYVESKAFDTHRSPQQSQHMVSYLSSLPRSAIVILSVKDDAATQLTASAISALKGLGSEFIGQLKANDSWGMVSVVGQGKLSEAYTPTKKGPATGFLASDMTLHTNFKLSRSGEHLGLYAPNKAVTDSLSFSKQERDISFGRQPDGSEKWCFFSKPTPKASNTTPCANGVAPPPEFAVNNGFYKGSVRVTLKTSERVNVHYTLDGATPTETSPKYTEPFNINKTQVVRARSFGDALIPSEVVTQIYFIDENVHLPILSIVTDPVNLWDPEIGIYTVGPNPRRPNYMQHGREWERPVSVEFFEENDSRAFTIEAGIRIFGGTTRHQAKKSFILHFRELYGSEYLSDRLFPEKNIDRFKNVVVRNGGNDGEEDRATLMRDPLMHALWAEEGGLVSAKRSVFVYLNGEPWGIYNLREHIDKEYLSSNFGVEDVDLIKERRTVEAGDPLHWDATYYFFENHDLSLSENYARAQTLIDVKNFTDFEIFQIYGGNIDLADTNLVRYRPRSPAGKWQWIMWDTDLSFALEPYNPVSHNTLAWETRDGPRPDLGPPWDDGRDTWSTLMLRKLLENDEYQMYFINRFADVLNTTLRSETVITKIDELSRLIEPDIPLDVARWGATWDGSYEKWLANVEGLRDFARRRPHFVRHHIIEKFKLIGIAFLTIESPNGAGSVRINTVSPNRYPWHVQYFQGVPVTLEAIPAAGYKFSGWSDPFLPQMPVVTISLPEFYNIRAIFAPLGQ